MSRMLQFGYAMQATCTWMAHGQFGNQEIALALTEMMVARRELGLVSYAGACPDCSSGEYISYAVSSEEGKRCTCGRIVRLYPMGLSEAYRDGTEMPMAG